MINVRKADKRGRTGIDWLDSRHTFSFGDYFDPDWVGFHQLRVINDDRVSPASGFGAHSHRDMEIISYVLSGSLGHEDSMGTGSTIHPGEVQRMSAGSGVMHSEWNHSKTEPVHFLQIWIVPDQRGIAPSYEQRAFEPHEVRDRLRLVGSRDGHGGSVTIHQDVALYLSRLSAGSRVSHTLAAGRAGWVQIAKGAATLNGEALREGDGAAITSERELELVGTSEAEILLFDLP